MTQDYLACLFERGATSCLEPLLADAVAAHGCRRRLAEDNMLLFAGEDLPVRALRQSPGWIVGHLFDSERCAASPELELGSPLDADRLIERVWGSYVLVAAAGATFEIIRDPSGGLACYHAKVGGTHYLTSMPHLLIDCGLVPVELDWTSVLHSLTRRTDRTPRTALRGIDEVLAGTRLTIGPRSTVARPVWDPLKFTRHDHEADPAERLRTALSSTLEAWGRSFHRPLIEISGGLDSAIVGAGLSPSARGASLITFAPAPGDPDETRYARAIAEHLGLPLEIARPCLHDVDLERSLSGDLPRPNARAFTQAADAQSLRYARAIGADAFVSGGGGDDVFGYLRTILPAIDRLEVQGVRAMASSALDIATMNHSTLWDALLRIGRRLIRRRPSVNRVDRRFIAAELAASSEIPAPDSVRAGCLPGKAEHVRAVMTIHNYLEGHARSQFAPLLSPLLSQPIVECCLSIPSWEWCKGGRNRATARRAFRGRLPQIVLERRSKGRFDGFCAALLDANRERVRAMLLEGGLAQQGLLDRSAIEAALATPFPSADVVSRLLVLVDVESWTSSWASRPVQRR